MSAVHGGGLHVVADYSAAPPFSLDNRTPNFSAFGPDGRVAGFDFDGSYEPETRFVRLIEKAAARAGADKSAPRLPRQASLYGRAVNETTIDELPDPAALAALGEAMMECTGGPTIGGDMPAAYTYLGQFIAHDVTKMATVDEADGKLNWRSSALDLDSLFGPVDRRLRPVPDTRFEAGLGLGRTSGGDAGFDDLPRTDRGEAAVPDPRNDNNLAVAQFHVSMIKFHQAVAARFAGESPGAQRRITLQHFQAVVLFDYLRRIVDQAVYRDVFLNGRAVVHAGVDLTKNAFLIPVEFAAACFRMGHSMVRSHYMMWGKDTGGALGQLLAFTFRGGSLEQGRLPADWVAHWPYLLDEGPDTSMRAALIDTRLAQRFFRLPDWMFPRRRDAEIPGTANLTARTLATGRRLLIPRAQSVAEQVRQHLGGRPPLDTLEDWRLDHGATDMVRRCLNAGDYGERLVQKTPLWFYTLREAEHFHQGKRLGPLASRIVMETLHAAIQAAPGGIIDADNRVFFDPIKRNGAPRRGPCGPDDNPYTLRDLFELATSQSSRGG